LAIDQSHTIMMAGPTALEISTGSTSVLTVSDATTTSINQASSGQFVENDYDTIEKGRTLNPVNFSFEDQDAIKIHLTQLAAMNHSEFEKSGNEINAEQQNLSELQSCYQKVKEVMRAAFYVGCEVEKDVAKLWPLESSKYDKENETRRGIIEEHHGFWVGQLKAAEAILDSPPDHIATEELFSMGKVTFSHDSSMERSREFIYEVCGCQPREWLPDDSKAEDRFDFSEPAVVDQAFHDKYGDFPMIKGQTERILVKIQCQYMQRIRESYRRVGGLLRKLCMLKKEERRCIAASKL